VVNANNPATSDGINLEGASYMTVKSSTINLMVTGPREGTLPPAHW